MKRKQQSETFNYIQKSTATKRFISKNRERGRERERERNDKSQKLLFSFLLRVLGMQSQLD